jgi:hypothetical protein
MEVGIGWVVVVVVVWWRGFKFWRGWISVKVKGTEGGWRSLQSGQLTGKCRVRGGRDDRQGLSNDDRDDRDDRQARFTSQRQQRQERQERQEQQRHREARDTVREALTKQTPVDSTCTSSRH